MAKKKKAYPFPFTPGETSTLDGWELHVSSVATTVTGTRPNSIYFVQLEVKKSDG